MVTTATLPGNPIAGYETFFRFFRLIRLIRTSRMEPSCRAGEAAETRVDVLGGATVTTLPPSTEGSDPREHSRIKRRKRKKTSWPAHNASQTVAERPPITFPLFLAPLHFSR